MNVEDRFDRARRMGWFDVDRMRRASVLLVGAGALGNEAGKNLVLSGLGSLTIVDPDRVVETNLHRCALFRPEDAARGAPKAEALARGLFALDPSCRIRPVVGAVEKLAKEDVAAHDVVVAGVDNVAARMATNALATAAARPLVDGGTRGTLGKVFVGLPGGPCLACATNASHARVASTRFACSGREDVVVFEPPLAADPVTTSVVGAILAREAVKILHGRTDDVMRSMLYYDGMGNRFEILEVARNSACPHHEAPP
ncbi:MAG TPA: ThiF family adenylyltransferase [Candidatus Thermoplasmatota archaeon]|nr:ThiF family adenylyltransferase [Candidatus Thermoplasmatota archaeon]